MNCTNSSSIDLTDTRRSLSVASTGMSVWFDEIWMLKDARLVSMAVSSSADVSVQFHPCDVILVFWHRE